MLYDNEKRTLLHLTRHDTDNYILIDRECPECGGVMYKCTDGGDQGGRPYEACTECPFIDEIIV